MSSLLTGTHKHLWQFNGSTGDSAGNRYRMYCCRICGQHVQVPAELGVMA